jgi:membrane protein
MPAPPIISLLKAAVRGWSEDNVPTLGAALAYYSIFSLAPVAVIAIGVASVVFQEEVARGQLVAEMEHYLGHAAAQALQDMLSHSSAAGGGWLATVIGLVTVLVGASGVFVQLQASLNTIWKVTTKPGRAFWNLVLQRLLSFGLVIVTALLALASMIANAALVGLESWLTTVFSPASVAWWEATNSLTSFAVLMVLFALVYKLLPDVIVRWRDVWVGALVTALLFTLGKYLIGLYLGRSGLSSAFGAAGSLVAILVWVYYSAQIVLFGAEFTRVYADCCGAHVVPGKYAMFVTDARHRSAAETSSGAPTSRYCPDSPN